MEIISNILPWIQIILSLVLIIAIILQRSGAEMGGALGGGDSGTTYHTRRGLEKFLFRLAIVVAVLFTISSLMAIFL
ncbi:preprotein translocase subunit SecG [Candidatus Nomurabacteria bacterium RIFCSPLOWO2_01_FULL_33_24]|uniref:Protein-export membrane protein SecG n=1 Tax=Candidatus Nomurabacteria bacterium RIFCSPLOWO2_01_FULL_33_24 TaxID=1801765 RepID=A0A1F6WYT2_9BACT|nr:MAG: preprotein translocase subunit SecG [Candidatus Nomurabacteria bacterium RIFCSPLOWO2_01_FULL_33_24]